MKIVTLGHSGVGKTTYMTSLYLAMQDGFEGFYLRALDNAHHRELMELGRQITINQYPPATAKRSIYRFMLQYQQADVLDFTWADYRGGAIDQASSDQQKAMLLEDLRDADGLMMLCDCSQMTPNWIGLNSPIGKHVQRMSQLVQYAAPHLTHPISLSIMLTKVDLVQVFKEKMLDPLGGVLSSVSVSDRISGALIPVACGSSFINVPMPLLFALQNAVRHKGTAMLANIKSVEGVAAREEQASAGLGGWFDRVGARIFGYETHAQKASTQRQQAASLRQEHRGIADSLAIIDREVRRLPLIRRGVSTYDYVSMVAGSVDKPAHHRRFLNLG
ncbi:MAG: hypothetical protein ACHQ1E_00655 [Ktedonobacterales bacterium]